MRTKNSLINSVVAIGCYFILFLGPFIVRPFIKELNGDLLGIEDLFLKAVAMLNIVEMGVSFGISYKLYKPLAENDIKRIAILINLYKKTFKIIAITIFTLGCITAVIIPLFVKENTFSDAWIRFVFMIYVLDALAAYLYGHKRAILIADQKNYLVNLSRCFCQLLMFITQAFIIYFFNSFIIYAVARLIFTTLENIIINIQYNKRYINIKHREVKETLPEKEKKDLFKNLGALMYHKIGAQSLSSASSFIIMPIVGSFANGVYGTYVMITNGVLRVTDQIFSSILASFGNYMVQNDKNKVFNLYKKIYFFNYLIFSFFSVSIFCLILPFVKLWMGESYLLSVDTIFLLSICFYIWGMRQSVGMVKNSAGIYRPDRFLSLIEAAINIYLSIILVKSIGIKGIILANIISMLIIPFWSQPYLIYKNVFNRKMWSYYKRYFIYLAITLFSGMITFFVCNLYSGEGFLKLLFNALACLIIPNLINLLLFYKTEEFAYLIKTFKNLIKKSNKKREG